VVPNRITDLLDKRDSILIVAKTIDGEIVGGVSLCSSQSVRKKMRKDAISNQRLTMNFFCKVCGCLNWAHSHRDNQSANSGIITHAIYIVGNTRYSRIFGGLTTVLLFLVRFAVILMPLCFAYNKRMVGVRLVLLCFY